MGAATNNVAELEAILRVLAAVPARSDVTVLTDSDYAVKALTVWQAGWRRNGWRNRAGAPVKNRDRIEAAADLIRFRTGDTRIEWVKGHANHPLNEAADRLAVRMRVESPRQAVIAGPGWVHDLTVL